jgi:hypothetical protein
MDQLSSLVERNKRTGTLVGSVVTVGAIAYLIRRAGQRRRPTDLGGKVSELAREVVGDDPLEAGQEFLRKQIVPELKPVLLAILDDVENVVADGFKRAEKAIKQM